MPVRLENNLIGTTDSSGLLLVTPLNSYQKNHISIDPMNLPIDVDISRVDAVATPTDRAGTMVRFAITPLRAAALILVDAAGKPLPLGSLVHLHGTHGDPTLVGFDGAVYLDGLTPHNLIDVETPSGTCHARFDYRKHGDDIPQIGPLVCAAGAAPGSAPKATP